MSRDVQWYTDLFRDYSDAIVVTDSEGLIVFANPAFEHLTGYGGTDLVGAPLSHFVAFAATPVLPCTKGPEAGWTQPVSAQTRRKGRGTLDVTVSSHPVPDGHGHVSARVSVVQTAPTDSRLGGLLAAIERCGAAVSAPVESWVAAVLDLGSDYFGTDYGALCLPDGSKRFTVCLDARQARNLQGGGRAAMAALAREIVELAANDMSETGTRSEDARSRVLSVPLTLRGGEGGVLLFGNHEIHVRPPDSLGRIALSAIAQIISARIPDKGLLAAPVLSASEAGEDARVVTSAAVDEAASPADPAYHAAFRAVPAMLVLLDERGGIADVTDAFLTRFGYGRTDIVGRSFRDVASMPDGTDAQALFDATGEGRPDGPAAMAVIATAQGDAVDVEVSLSHPAKGGSLAAIVDIGERARARTRIEKRNVELERLNENLQSFASIASHDMQEPLRKIRYFTEMLQRALAEDNQEDVEYALEVLSSASRRASRLVSDLLTFSRSSSENLVREPIDLVRLLRGLVEEIRHEEAAPEADIRINVPPVVVTGDPTTVVQLFRNLIGNALKYRAADRVPRVEISASVAGDAGRALQISIADNGIGFDPQYAQAILQPFRRLHRRQEIPGSGIGLAICDVVARRHGWMLTADGRVGSGATFTVTIPEYELEAVTPSPSTVS